MIDLLKKAHSELAELERKQQHITQLIAAAPTAADIHTHATTAILNLLTVAASDIPSLDITGPDWVELDYRLPYNWAPSTTLPYWSIYTTHLQAAYDDLLFLPGVAVAVLDSGEGYLQKTYHTTSGPVEVKITIEARIPACDMSILERLGKVCWEDPTPPTTRAYLAC